VGEFLECSRTPAFHVENPSFLSSPDQAPRGFLFLTPSVGTKASSSFSPFTSFLVPGIVFRVNAGRLLVKRLSNRRGSVNTFFSYILRSVHCRAGGSSPSFSAPFPPITSPSEPPRVVSLVFIFVSSFPALCKFFPLGDASALESRNFEKLPDRLHIRALLITFLVNPSPSFPQLAASFTNDPFLSSGL